ncbi:hypothetical protein SKAU_G00216540 [Synaphobranchus kaupii]|uniref:Uncharacterized protein n=1 Tax=Synaphobranchus kaupii TaxID=118154 RepID=A0A9Q1FA54_SYNKA|nr:hypothetical protein SKAU_G00216540 [Synaphobranchus kaupii]
MATLAQKAAPEFSLLQAWPGQTRVSLTSPHLICLQGSLLSRNQEFCRPAVSPCRYSAQGVLCGSISCSAVFYDDALQSQGAGDFSDKAAYLPGLIFRNTNSGTDRSGMPLDKYWP